MFLTQEDIKELTDRQRPADQIKWLTDHGWPFEVSAIGRPKVAIEEFNRRMLTGGAKRTKNPEPDFEWMEQNA